MDIFNGVLSVVIYTAIGMILLLYVPISLVYRFVFHFFVRPFSKENIEGKVVLITGASSGIGEQLAYQYAKKGACLVLAARREVALKSVAETARELGSPDVLVVPTDVSNSTECQKLIEKTIAQFGRINHLVVNAGIATSCLFEDVTNLPDSRQVMDVNYWGEVYPTYYALPYLKKSRGNIIVMASMAGCVPVARLSFYNASKAAVLRFYETLRAELSKEVKITILTLGYVVSDLTRGRIFLKGGELGFNEEMRDLQISPFPVGCTEKCAEVVVDGACKGDRYVTWPCWFGAFHMVMCIAPELVNWFSRMLYIIDFSGKTLSQKIVEVSWIKKLLFPASIRSVDKSLYVNEDHATKVQTND